MALVDENTFLDGLNRLSTDNCNEFHIQDICLDKNCKSFLEDTLHCELTYKDPVLIYKKQELNQSECITATPGQISVQENGLDNNSTENNHIYSQDCDQSLEGTPLKLQTFHMDCPLVQGLSTDFCNSKEDKPIISGRPLDVTLARYLLTLYTMAVDSVSDSTPSVWVYCDATDHEGTVLLGAFTQRLQEDQHKSQKSSSKKNPVQNRDSNHESVVTRTYKVTSKGPYTHKEQFPKVQSIIKKHFSQNAKVKTKCFADYDVFGAVSVSRDVSTVQSQSSLQIKLEWENPSTLLQTPPLDSKSTVEATIMEGDMRSAAYSMYTELHTLQGFTDGIKDGVVEWAVERDEEESVKSRLKLMLDDLKQGDYGKRMSIKPQDDDDEAASPLKNLVLIDRKDLDFTEQLWNILKECTCYSDLISGLELVLSYLHNGLLQPMVHKSNKSRLAQLVRDSYYGKMVMPSMEGLLPLEILVEIGTEKLQRDYTNAFKGKDLVTDSHLEYFVKMGETHKDKLERLAKLHSALEVAVMLEQYLNLPRPTLSMSARQALKYYETNTLEESHTFSVPVQTKNVAHAIERCHATVWKIKLLGNIEQNKSMCASYVLTTRPLFGNVNHQINGQNTEIEEDAIHYYLTTESENVIVL